MNIISRYSIAVIMFFSVSAPALGQQWSVITAGGEFSLAVLSDGTLWGCGYNGNGQLGTGDTDPRETFSRLTDDTDWADVEAGGFHTLALKRDGSLWSFGLNGRGQLGHGDTDDRLVPTQIGEETDWIAIDAGYATSYAIRSDGSLWAWGYNPYGQVGNGESGNQLREPVRVLGDHEWAMVSAGGVHVLAVTREGHLYSWGGGPNGQLGQGAEVQFLAEPGLVDSTREWISISAGFEFSTGVTADGKLWSWGFNGNGQLGQGDYFQRTEPMEITAVSEVWKDCEAGSSFVYATTDENAMYAWGANIHGQLGFNDAAERRIPEKVPSEIPWSDIAAAEGIISNQLIFGHHAFALHQDRQVICVAGANYGYQIGLPEPEPSVVFNCSIGDLTLDVDAPAFQPQTLDLYAYPNPAQDHLVVRLEDHTGSGHEVRDAILCDMLGRRHEVSYFSDNGQLLLDVASLPRGQYFLRVMTERGELSTERIVLR